MKKNTLHLVMALLAVAYGLFQGYLILIMAYFTKPLTLTPGVLFMLVLAAAPFACAYMLVSGKVVLQRIGYGIFASFALLAAALLSIYST